MERPKTLAYPHDQDDVGHPSSLASPPPGSSARKGRLVLPRGGEGTETDLAPQWQIIEHVCLDALHAEASAWPKPGLVSPVDAGSHRDMSYFTFLASIAALEGYFAAIAAAGAANADFLALQALGLTAERRMLAATCAANTHRGAIFNLGLLAAAAGARTADPALMHLSCGEIVASRWGPAILASRPVAPTSHGNTVFRRYAVGGAREEAADGFATVYEVGLPALRRLLDRGVDDERALIGSLLALMSTLADTNLLWRGGEAGLVDVQEAARHFNDAGGVEGADWRECLVDMHQALVARNLSPGGSADLVAATWVVHRLECGLGAA